MDTSIKAALNDTSIMKKWAIITCDKRNLFGLLENMLICNAWLPFR